MKNKATQYFGNQIANALRARASRASKTFKNTIISSPAMVEVSSEFESLESRILLSGIGTGLNKKSVTFFDAAGDKVQVSIAGAKGATFNIDLGGATNNADISEIQINTAGASLAVQVTPVGSFTKPVVTTTINDPGASLNANGAINFGTGSHNIALRTQTSEYQLTPGYTEIGQITVAAGVTSIGSINLVAADVQDINLTGVTAGNINLSTGLVHKVDQTLAKNNAYADPGYVADVNIGNIDLHNIEAASVKNININGFGFNNNSFDGIITVANSIGSITGGHSQINNQIDLTAANSTLGNIVVGGFGNGFGIHAAGSLTVQNAAGINGTIETVGDLHIGFNQGAFGGTILAGGNISGLHTGSPILLFNGADISDATFQAVGSISNIVLGNGSSISGSTFDAASIGLLTATSGAGNPGNGISNDTFSTTGDFGGLHLFDQTGLDTTTIDVAGKLGVVTIDHGPLSASIAAGSIGAITVVNGNLAAGAHILSTTAGIDSVTVTHGSIENGAVVESHTSIGTVIINDGQLKGAIIAGGDKGITSISVNALGNVQAIADNAIIYSAGSIGTLSATATGNLAVIGKANITTLGAIQNFKVANYGTGAGLDGILLSEPSIGNLTVTSVSGNAINGGTFTSTTGSIGNITAVGGTGGITGDAKFTAATSIGNISGTATISGSGINGATFNALAGAIGSISGTGFTSGLNSVTATGSAIGAINGFASTGTGITGGTFTATTNDIGAISGTSRGTGDGVANATFTAQNGLVTSLIGAANSGAALNTVTVTGATGIGAITGTSATGAGITGGNFLAVTGNIGAISGTSHGNQAGIGGGASFTAQAGLVTSVTGSSNSFNGIDGITVSGSTGIGAISGTSTTGSGIAGGTFTSINGAIASISGTDLNGSAAGISGGTYTAATGIGQISGSSYSGVGISGIIAEAQNGDITGVSGSTVTGTAIGDGQFTADNGKIGSISATPTGVGGNAINGATFTAVSFSDLSFKVSNTQGGYAVNNLTINATAGGINSITVSDASTRLGSYGINASNITATGDIGPISVTTAGGYSVQALDVTSSAGALGTVTVVNTSTNAASYGIGGVASNFKASGAIGNISVTTAGGDAINGTTFQANTSGKGGNIGTVTVSTSGSNASGIAGATFSGSNIGTITSKVTSSNGAGVAISGATFTASNVVETAPGSGVYNNTGTIGTGGVGIIVSNSSLNPAADGIVGSTFTAGGAGAIGSITVTTAGGTSIQDSKFTATANADCTTAFTGTIGDVLVTSSGNGIVGTFANNTQFLANGSIGTVTVVSSDVGIRNSQFVADKAAQNVGQIGNISVTVSCAGQNGIDSSNFTAATLNTITSKLTSGSGVGYGIIGSQFTAQNIKVDGPGVANDVATIGAITVSNNSITGGGAIDSSTFTAGAAGAIGNIIVSSVGGTGVTTASSFTATHAAVGETNFTSTIGTVTINTGLNAFSDSTISAESSINAISITSVAGAGIVNGTITATDGAKAGDITSLTVHSKGNAVADNGVGATTITANHNFGAIDLQSDTASAINFDNKASQITVGNDLTSFSAKSLSTSAVVNAIQATGKADEALFVGNDVTGNITVSNSSTNAAADALNNVKFHVVNNIIGATTITAAAGAAMNNASIDPVNTGAITLSGPNGAMLNSSILATGTVDKLTTTGLIDGTSSITVGSINVANPVSITGNLAGTITTTVGSIGNITVLADATNKLAGDVSGAITSFGSIGTITIAGALKSEIKADTNGKGLGIGGVTVGNGITNTGTITDALGALASLTVSANGDAGKVSVGSITGAVSVTGNLSGTITTTAGNIGNITVLADATNKLAGDVSGAITSFGSIGTVGIAGALSSEIKADTNGKGLGIGGVTLGNGITITGNITDNLGALASLTVSANGDAGSVIVGSITGTTSVTGNLSGTITATASTGSIIVLADGKLTPGNLSGSITAGTGVTGGSITSISVAGDLTGNITAGNVAVVGSANNGTIGAITAATINNAILTQSKDGAESIGVITATNGIIGGTITSGGAIAQIVTTAGGAVLNVNAGSITNGLSISGDTFGKVTTGASIGAISITADGIVSKGDFTATVTAGTGVTGGSITSISIAGDLFGGSITAGNAAVAGGANNGTIGTITANTIFNAILTQSKDGADSVGVITATNGIIGGSTITSGGAIAQIVTKAGGAVLNVNAGSITNGLSISGDTFGKVTTGASIGAISITADGIISKGDFTATVTAGTGVTGGSITSISVAGDLFGGNITAGNVAVVGSANNGTIGNITANTINDAILTQSKDGADSIGVITASNGIIGGTITSGGAIAQIVTTAGGAVLNVNAGSITNGLSISGDTFGKVTTGASIGDITITADGIVSKGAFAATVTAGTGLTGGSIGKINVADSILFNSITAGNVAVVGSVSNGTIGTITAGGITLNPIVTHSSDGTDSIGDITIIGKGLQAVNVTTGSVGNITANGLAATDSLGLSVTSATKLGNVTTSGILSQFGGAALTSIGNIQAAGNVTLDNLAKVITTGNLISTTGSLTIGGLASATTIGNVTATGAFTLSNGDLSKVHTLGNITVGSFAVPVAIDQLVGDGTVGSSVGTINIGADQAAIGAPAAGNPSGSNYIFEFDTYAGVTQTVVAQSITPAVGIAGYNTSNANGASTALGFAFINI